MTEKYVELNKLYNAPYGPLDESGLLIHLYYTCVETDGYSKEKRVGT